MATGLADMAGATMVGTVVGGRPVIGGARAAQLAGRVSRRQIASSPTLYFMVDTYIVLRYDRGGFQEYHFREAGSIKHK